MRISTNFAFLYPTKYLHFQSLGLLLAFRAAQRTVLMKKARTVFWTALTLIGVSFPGISGNSIVQAAQVHSTPPSSVGALLGASFISSTTQFTLGIEGIHKIMPPWGVGATLTYYNAGTTLPNNTNYSNRFVTITAQAFYMFAEALEGLRVGAQGGLGIATTDIPGASGSTDFIFGPTAGYDYVVANQFSVGGEGTIYFTTATNGSTLFQVLGAVKYWF
jgi:hypothetical protein